eukprot:TRINITY_DN4477_c0_g1_i1.p1 TRINITY_DN4477_c0_g1~~TRINITY_DN4477_c0_g1_i1.p1  ORF type:complete len:582 (-),score=189.52 TRINITY_DN4477_c0_g1_i1:33-1778(-)
MAPKKGKRSGKGKKEKEVAPKLAAKEEETPIEISDRNVTGVLASQALARDVRVEGFSLEFHGRVLVEDCVLTLNHGRRYGLLAPNGAGKSTLLRAIASREVPLPDHIDVYMLDGEYPKTDLTPIEAVMDDVETQKERLEELAEELSSYADPSPEIEDQLHQAYEDLDNLDTDVLRIRGSEILHGLGFTKVMMKKTTSEFSGGWRMRISLAKALLKAPTMLLLDEPSNHLDLEAVVWLEDFLSRYSKILLLVSHSQDFLNTVCTNIIHLHLKKLMYYGGNFDSYVQARADLELNQQRKHDKEQEDISHMKEYIARFGHGNRKMARQAQSKEKTLAKMVEKGLTLKPQRDRTISLFFPECSKLPPPILQFNNTAFGYPNSPELFRNLEFGVDLDSRIALVGKNGGGKSTLLKLMHTELIPTDGMIRRHSHLKIARYHQHSEEQLDMDKCPLQYMMDEFPQVKELEKMRSQLGRFGITGKEQTTPISQLSDGQKSQIVFAWISMQHPHLLLLDEPTNHLSTEMIDSLAEAVNAWNGGMVLVSHDFRLIDQVAKEIWICGDGKLTKWHSDIRMYKEQLKKDMGLA